SVAVDAPTYDCNVAADVSYLDVAAVHNREEGLLTLFIVNRHLTETAELDIGLTGVTDPILVEHHAMEGYGLHETNGPDKPDHVVPKVGSGIGVEDGKLKGSLKALSYHVLRLKIG